MKRKELHSWAPYHVGLAKTKSPARRQSEANHPLSSPSSQLGFRRLRSFDSCLAGGRFACDACALFVFVSARRSVQHCFEPSCSPARRSLKSSGSFLAKVLRVSKDSCLCTGMGRATHLTCSQDTRPPNLDCAPCPPSLGNAPKVIHESTIAVVDTGTKRKSNSNGPDAAGGREDDPDKDGAAAGKKGKGKGKGKEEEEEKGEGEGKREKARTLVVPTLRYNIQVCSRVGVLFWCGDGLAGGRDVVMRDALAGVGVRVCWFWKRMGQAATNRIADWSRQLWWW